MSRLKKKRPGIVMCLAIMNMIVGVGWGLCCTCGGAGVVANQKAIDEVQTKMEGAKERLKEGVEAERKALEEKKKELGEKDKELPDTKRDAKVQQRLQAEWGAWGMNIAFSNVPGLGQALAAFLISQIVLSWTLVIAGVGLLLVKKWGRLLTWVYALLSLLSLALMVVYGLTSFAENMPKQEVVDWAKIGKQEEFMNPQQADQLTKAIQEQGGGPFSSSFIQLGIFWGLYPALVFVFLCLPPFNRAFATSKPDTPASSKPPADEDDWGSFGTRPNEGGPIDQGPPRGY